MSGMDLHIDDNLVRPVIEKEIQAAIVREMDKQKELLPQIVSAVIRMKVDRDGRPSTYSDSQDYITWAFRDAIQGAVKIAIKDYLEKNKGAFEKELEKQIKLNSSGLAASMIKSLNATSESQWRMTVNVEVPKD